MHTAINLSLISGGAMAFELSCGADGKSKMRPFQIMVVGTWVTTMLGDGGRWILKVDVTQTNRQPHLFMTLDGIRGGAAMLIAVRHSTAFFQPVAFQESYLAVDLFFMLSGVVICHSYEHRLSEGLSVGRFMWIRLVRIYPLYILGSALTAVAVLIGPGAAVDHGLLAVQAMEAVLLVPDVLGAADYAYPLNAPAWSLAFELFVNLAYGLLLLRWRLDGQMLVVIMAVSAVAMAAFIAFGRRHSLDIGWTVRSFPTGFFRVSFSFFAGVLIYRGFVRATKAGPRRVQSGWVPWGLIAAAAALLTASPNDAMRGWYDGVVVTVAFPAVIWLSLRTRPGEGAARAFRLFGVLSYPVYALHIGVGLLAQAAVVAVSGQAAAAYAPWIGGPFLVVLMGACWALNRGYDAPVRRWLLLAGASVPAAGHS